MEVLGEVEVHLEEEDMETEVVVRHAVEDTGIEVEDPHEGVDVGGEEVVEVSVDQDLRMNQGMRILAETGAVLLQCTERRDEDLHVTSPHLHEDHTEDLPHLVEVHPETTPLEVQEGCLLEARPEVILGICLHVAHQEVIQETCRQEVHPEAQETILLEDHRGVLEIFLHEDHPGDHRDLSLQEVHQEGDQETCPLAALREDLPEICLLAAHQEVPQEKCHLVAHLEVPQEICPPVDHQEVSQETYRHVAHLEVDQEACPPVAHPEDHLEIFLHLHIVVWVEDHHPEEWWEISHLVVLQEDYRLEDHLGVRLETTVDHLGVIMEDLHLPDLIEGKCVLFKVA